LKSYRNLKECEMGYFSMVCEKIGGKVVGRKRKRVQKVKWGGEAL